MKFKLLVGTVLTLASVFALLVLTGSIGDRGKYSESALLVRLAMDCPRLREDDKMELQAAALVSDQDELALRFSAFGSELDRAERRRMVQSCDSIIYQLNIIPEEIRLSGPHVPPIKPEQTDCPKRGPFVGCYLLAGDTY